MALNSGFANLDPVSDTFSDWLNKTNEMITLMREDVITANTAGAETSGDAILIGSFYANNLIAHDSLRGGDYAASDTLYISSNVHIQNTAIDTIVWKDFEVNGNSHFGAVANGTHTVQITGDFLVSLDATFQNDMYIDGTSANAVQWLSATDEMNFNDNVELTFGTDSDLVIRHNGTDSEIADNGTGNLYIRATNLTLSANDGSRYIVGNDGTSVEIFSPAANTLEVTITDVGMKVENEANTNTLTVRSTSRFQGNIGIEGSTDANTVTWDKTTNTLNFDDNNFATFGTSGDLSVFHDGTNSYIRNTTGELIAQGNGITLRSHTGTESYLTADQNGAVSLFYDASVHTTAKLVTQAGGVTVTGNVVADGFVAGDGEKVQLGNAQDLEIFHEATGNSIIQENGAGSLVLKANSTIIQSTAGENYFQGVADGAATIYYNGNAKLDTKDDGVDVTGLTTTDTLEVQGNATFDGTSVDLLQWVSTADTLNFNDSVKATFGTDGDMQVYHTGSTGIIDSLNTDIISNTSLDVKTDALIIESANGENYITATVDGQVDLYFDNSVKLETKTGGIQVTGNVVSDGFVAGDGEKVQLGASQDLQIYHEATGNSIIAETGAGSLVLKGNNVIIESTSGENYFQGIADGASTLYYNGNAKLDTKDDGVDVTGVTTTDTLEVQGDATFDGTSVDLLQWVSASNILNFDDSVQATFGTDGDMKVYHNGTTGTIDSVDLDIVANTTLDIKTDALIIESANGENYITATVDGQVDLYFDNNVKLETKTGGITVTGNVVSDGFVAGDGEKVQLGNSQDLQIYHEATGNSIIAETGAGSLVLKGNNVIIETTDGSDYFQGEAGGSATIYHNGNARLATNASGVVVTGNVVADGLTMGDNELIRLGDGTDLTIQHNGTNSVIENNTGELILQSNGITLQSDNSETFITADVNGSVTLYYDNTVGLTTRSGGTDIAGEANTGTLLVNGISNTAANAYFGASIIPTTTGNDIGTSTLRFDAFLSNTSVNGYIRPTSNTQSIGQTTGRWNIFANTINASGDATITGSATVETSLTVNSTSEFNDNVTIDADATCTANVVTENLQVNGTANVNILQLVDLHANNFAIVGGEGEITLSSSATDVVVDTVAASESRGFKYFIEGRNTNANSCYVVEISVAHNGTDVFFTRYGEIGNNFDAVWNVGMNGANVELMVTCAGAAPATNVHSFNIIKYQTR